MLLIFVTSILLASAVLLVIARDRRSLLLFLCALSFWEYMSTFLMYVAKKGGISSEVNFILFGSRVVRNYLQYFIITLPQLGYLMAIGRYLLPLFLVLTALEISYFDWAVRLERHAYLLVILPVFSLVLYYPSVFHYVTLSEYLLRTVVIFSRLWVYLYIFSSLAILFFEYFSITINFFRRRFVTKIFIIMSMAVLFSLYASQDPAQVYLFYRNDYMWMIGLKYLSPIFNPLMYSFVLSVSVIFSFVGFFYFIKYLSVSYDEKRQEIRLSRKADAASVGVGMFTHGTKNELLAEGILLRKALERYAQDEELKRALRINENLIGRLNHLNHSLNAGSATLTVQKLKPLLEKTLRLLQSRYPQALVSFTIEDEDIEIFADESYLEDAILNLLMNAWEANLQNGKEDEQILLSVSRERLWILLSVEDRGRGIDRSVRKKIWEPFYSSKNRSTNWGMGMYFTRRVVKNHLGSIRFEDRENGGTRFIVLFPRVGKIEREVRI